MPRLGGNLYRVLGVTAGAASSCPPRAALKERRYNRTRNHFCRCAARHRLAYEAHYLRIAFQCRPAVSV